MATDVDRYKDRIWVYDNGKLYKRELWEIEGMTFSEKHDFNHFVKKQVMKNQSNNYKRWEKYQRMILMPHEMNLDIENMSPAGFEKKWKIPLYVVSFNRDRWRCGFYESNFFRSYYEQK